MKIFNILFKGDIGLFVKHKLIQNFSMNLLNIFIPIYFYTIGFSLIEIFTWFFLFALGGFVGVWMLFDILLGAIDITIGAISFSLIIFLGTNSAISFGLATKIKNNRDKKKEFFDDWLLAEFFLCMFAIFAVAVYVW